MFETRMEIFQNYKISPIIFSDSFQFQNSLCSFDSCYRLDYHVLSGVRVMPEMVWYFFQLTKMCFVFYIWLLRHPCLKPPWTTSLSRTHTNKTWLWRTLLTCTTPPFSTCPCPRSLRERRADARMSHTVQQHSVKIYLALVRGHFSLHDYMIPRGHVQSQTPQQHAQDSVTCLWLLGRF